MTAAFEMILIGWIVANLAGVAWLCLAYWHDTTRAGKPEESERT